MAVTQDHLKGFMARAQAAEAWAAKLEKDMAELKANSTKLPSSAAAAAGINPEFRKQLVGKLNNLKKIVQEQESKKQKLLAENTSLTTTKEKLEYRLYHLTKAIKHAQENSC